MDNIYAELIEKIDTWLEKDVEVLQSGFMEARYILEKIKSYVAEDILTIFSVNQNKLSLNLNMISNVKIEKDNVTIYIDNDCIIELKASF